MEMVKIRNIATEQYIRTHISSPGTSQLLTFSLSRFPDVTNHYSPAYLSRKLLPWEVTADHYITYKTGMHTHRKSLFHLRRLPLFLRLLLMVSGRSWQRDTLRFHAEDYRHCSFIYGYIWSFTPFLGLKNMSYPSWGSNYTSSPFLMDFFSDFWMEDC